MKMLLLDDEPLALKMLENAVAEAVPGAEVNSFLKVNDALEFAAYNLVQIAFLDINMNVMNGLDVARKLKEINPTVNIIFSTGYEEYALDALKMYSSGYLLKPIDADDIADVMQNLRYPVDEHRRLSVRCFGNFEVFCDGKPMKFKLSRTKELFAYLIDRNGAECKAAEIISVLFEDVYNAEYYSKIRRDLLKTFEEYNVAECINVTHGGLSVNRDMIECDYFDFKDGKINTVPDEYMSQYSFAEFTFSNLLK